MNRKRKRKARDKGPTGVSVEPLPLDKWSQQPNGRLEIGYPPCQVTTWPVEAVDGDHARWCGAPLGCLLGHVEVTPPL